MDQQKNFICRLKHVQAIFHFYFYFLCFPDNVDPSLHNGETSNSITHYCHLCIKGLDLCCYAVVWRFQNIKTYIVYHEIPQKYYIISKILYHSHLSF